MPGYETTAEQREQLLTDGFTLLSGAIDAEILSRWQAIAKKLEENALAAHAEGERLHGACVIEDPVGPRLMRYDDILNLHRDETLDLLATPAMMAVARELCGEGAVPMQFDVLYKHQHPHPVINWHQGAPHPRGYPYLNVGIYLDDADANDGCLHYVPGTQHEMQDICELSQQHGWQIPGVVEAPAKAGDIMVQDMMILHGSPPKRSDGVRRTIYVEIRPAAGIIESGEQSECWAELRKRWMGLVLRRASSEDWPQEWQPEFQQPLGDDADEITEIISKHESPIPAVYCYQPIERDDYPVPADMR